MHKNQQNNFLSISAIRFIFLLGLVSLFSDVTYEGARSIVGPFLANLGASATAAGFIFGFAEFIGYGIRLFSGYLSDKTGKPWLILISGYALNLFSVPLLALAGQWQIAAILIFLERTGKAIRAPVRDTLISHAASITGRGWGFGLHEAMDQIGAILGPALMALVLYRQGSYQLAFAVLLIPALLALFMLILARFRYPKPRDFEPVFRPLPARNLEKTFWLYLIAAGFIALGYADFPLIAFHLQRNLIVMKEWVPIFYAAAMATDAFAALVLGRLFDRFGLKTLLVVILLSAGFAPLVFLGNFTFALTGMILWGIGMGAQESILRAGLSLLAPPEKRGTIFGTFHAVFGTFWFGGSLLIGFLLDHSITLLILFSVLAQICAFVLFWRLNTSKMLSNS